jgi:hypothetical protein
MLSVHNPSAEMGCVGAPSLDYEDANMYQIKILVKFQLASLLNTAKPQSTPLARPSRIP